MELMIDLETLDTTATSVVLSVGMMLFDRNGRELDRLVIHPDFQEQVDAGRTISFSTLRFWVAQDGEAVKQTFVDIPLQVSVDETRRLFREFAHRCWAFPDPGQPEGKRVEEVEAVWANGDLFDLGICTNLLGDMPWRYNAPRDLRTMMREAQGLGWIMPEPREGHAQHSAIDDCRYQVDCLMSVRRFLGSMHGSRELLGRAM